MRPPWSALVALVLLVAVPLIGPTATAAPPPEGVCGVCGDAFERAAEQAGLAVTVGRSNATVRITDSGVSHWRASVTLDERTATRFAANRTLLRTVVERTYASSRTVVDDPENLSIALADRTMTVRFSVDDVTHRYPGGVVVFDGFARSQPNGVAYVDANRLTLRGPPGTTVTHAPGDGRRSGGHVVWSTGDDRTADTRFGATSTVAFAPSDVIGHQVATAGAIRAHTLGWLAPELRAYGTVPALLLAAVAGGLLLGGGRVVGLLSRTRAVARSLAIGAVGYAAVTFVAALVGYDGVAYVLAGAGVALVPQVMVTATACFLAGHVDGGILERLTTVALLAVVGWTVALVLGAPASATLVVLFGPLVFLPFGVLARVRSPARWTFPIVAALGPVVAALPFVPRGGIVFVPPAMLAVVAAGSAVFGSILFAVGWQVAPTTDASTPAKSAQPAS